MGACVCAGPSSLGGFAGLTSGEPTFESTAGYPSDPDSGAQPQVGLELIPTSSILPLLELCESLCARDGTQGARLCECLGRPAVLSWPWKYSIPTARRSVASLRRIVPRASASRMAHKSEVGWERKTRGMVRLYRRYPCVTGATTAPLVRKGSGK